MKKLYLLALSFLMSCSAWAPVHAAAFDLIINQRNSIDNGNVLRTLASPATDGLFYYNATTLLPGYLTLGSSLTITNGVLNTAPGGAQINVDWNATTGIQQILNKPALKTVALTGQAGDLTGLAPVALSGAYADLTGRPTLFSGAYADLSGKPALATVATTGSYNDLSDKPAAPAAYVFDFGQPAARTLALSTSYQASNTAKAAVVTVSPSCSASLSLSGGTTCTLQARIGTAPLTCASGVVAATWTNGNTGTLTVGLALNQIVGAPYGLHLPVGASFILCPTSGTWTISAAEQTAG